MIGYYAHHVGRGHVHRATAFAAAWQDGEDETVVGISSSGPPPGWRGPWRRVPRDDEGAEPQDPTARGTFHWAPLGDPGLRARTAAISAWIEQHRPRALVVDVSVEVILLARLHGVPVVSIVQPGRRADPAHLTGLRAADALVCPWPEDADACGAMLPGMPSDIAERAVRVGAVSRCSPRARPRRAAPGPPRHVVVLDGTGGRGDLGRAAHARRRASGTGAGTPWSLTLLAAGSGWQDDPTAALAAADVVVSHAGGGALADVASARVPAVVVPGERPHEEQRTTAAVLAAGPWPVVVRDNAVEALAPSAIEEASTLDGSGWETWCDGRAPQRMGDVVRSVALPREVRTRVRR